MELKLNLADGVPLYQQIVTQLRYQITAGRLKIGTELPAIRALAESLKINPNTVARAYRELELEGLVEKRSTNGTFVSDQGSYLTKRHRLKLLGERIDQLLSEARQMDIALAEVLDLIHKRDAVMDRNKEERPDVDADR